VSHNCGLSADTIQRVVQPTVSEDADKAPGLRFGTVRTREANGSEHQANIEPFAALHLDPDQF